MKTAIIGCIRLGFRIFQGMEKKIIIRIIKTTIIGYIGLHFRIFEGVEQKMKKYNR